MTTDDEALREAARALGRKGGQARSERKAQAVRENGKKGGRPRKDQARDRGNGRYAHEVERLCTCGHALGAHTAARHKGAQPCLEDCSCEAFLPAHAPEK